MRKFSLYLISLFLLISPLHATVFTHDMSEEEINEGYECPDGYVKKCCQREYGHHPCGCIPDHLAKTPCNWLDKHEFVALTTIEKELRKKS